MALQVTFGSGATAQQKKLDASDAGYVGDDKALNGPTVSESSSGGGNVGGVVDGDSVVVDTVTVPGGQSGTGGSVEIGFSMDNNAFTFTSSGWNAVKNVKAVSDTAENVTFTDFVHVDVDLRAASAASSVTIENVKRANVLTGSGADTIDISLATNNGDYQNTINVSSGAGGDTITIGAGTKTGIAGITNGRFTVVTIDAGAGNDTIDLSGVNLKSSKVTAGLGNDSLTGSDGADTYVYNAAFTAKVGNTLVGNGLDVISNFQVSEDVIDLNGVVPTSHSDNGGNLSIILSDKTQIVLQGVSDSQFSSIMFV